MPTILRVPKPVAAIGWSPPPAMSNLAAAGVERVVAVTLPMNARSCEVRVRRFC
jgi:thiamine monophosphate synthase